MTAQFARAPHQGRPEGPAHTAPNAALLIDFDNVTMGIRSDLSKELKKLLNSAVIKGKVAVQRAYADWRRYPQYIVPLSEASVDLIFAPAYGTTKKNATDIRLAIDALELVFTRPEIGTYILLSGDSDFSSLVLKLKEYGKYVIGVGMRESSSDLLVQNCDEYYSYSSLAGLTRAGDEEQLGMPAEDPFVLVERAVKRMTERRDVMRSDRLKQVLLELNPAFDERELGYKKFTKFLTDAGTRGALGLRKLENGQYEVTPAPETARADGTQPTAPSDEGRPAEGRAPRGDGRRGRAADEVKATPVARPVAAEAPEAVVPEPVGANGATLRAGFDLLQRAVAQLAQEHKEAPRDSDVKRRMLELEPDWDEADLGFAKFSRFLREAHDAEIVDLRRANGGSYEVVIPTDIETSTAPPRGRGRTGRRGPRRGQAAPSAPEPTTTATGPDRARATQDEPAPEPDTAETVPVAHTEAEQPEAAADARAEPTSAEPTGVEPASPAPSVPPADHATAAERRAAVGLRFRRGTRGRSSQAVPPPVLAGQTIADEAAPAEPERPETPETPAEPKPRAQKSRQRNRKKARAEAGQGEAQQAPPRTKAPVAADRVAGLPSDGPAVVAYIANSYKGVGKKTAETLVDAFGADRVFDVLANEPDRVREVLGEGRRTNTLIAAWRADRERRIAAADGTEPKSKETEKAAPKPKAAARTRSKAAQGEAKASTAEPAAKAATTEAPGNAGAKQGSGKTGGSKRGGRRSRPKAKAKGSS